MWRKPPTNVNHCKAICALPIWFTDHGVRSEFYQRRLAIPVRDLNKPNSSFKNKDAYSNAPFRSLSVGFSGIAWSSSLSSAFQASLQEHKRGRERLRNEHIGTGLPAVAQAFQGFQPPVLEHRFFCLCILHYTCTSPLDVRDRNWRHKWLVSKIHWMLAGIRYIRTSSFLWQYYA